MSILSILEKHLQSGVLAVLPSEVTGYETARTVVVSRDLFNLFSQELSDDLQGERLAELRLTLDAFSEHGQFSVAEDPDRKPPDTMLSRVHEVGDEFWSMRITLPEDTAGIRALGGFADKDKFVVLSWEFRERMVDFSDEVNSVKNLWLAMFEGQYPYSGTNLDDYLTNYIAV